MNPKISIIIAVYNEEKLIGDCLDALIGQDYPKEDYEIIVVNDGSTDNTLKTIEKKQKEAKTQGLELTIIDFKENKGWVIARETGCQRAKYQNCLFTDSRCLAHSNVLSKIREINYQPINGNPLIDFKRSTFDRFNWLIRKKLYPSSFGENFKPIFITKDNFDQVSKGTTIFFCDKELFLLSQPKNKSKIVSEDIKLLWNIAQKRQILKHPDIKVTYLSRTSVGKVVKHIFQRGPRFVDYHLSPPKKYFWLFIFSPTLALFFTITLIFIDLSSFLYWLGLLVLVLAAGAVWFGENIKDFFIVLGFLPPIGTAFFAGISKGLILKLFKRY